MLLADRSMTKHGLSWTGEFLWWATIHLEPKANASFPKPITSCSIWLLHTTNRYQQETRTRVFGVGGNQDNLSVALRSNYAFVSISHSGSRYCLKRRSEARPDITEAKVSYEASHELQFERRDYIGRRCDQRD